MNQPDFNLKHFIVITLLASIWINISEVFRYFLIVMPQVKSFFNDRPEIATMDWGIFIIWTIWDMLLTAILVFFFWLVAQVYGNSKRSILISSSVICVAIFVMFWVATANMGMSYWKPLVIILPLCWIEMFIGTWITSKLYKKIQNDKI